MNGTILITGASSGIGAAVAQHFLAQGWKVGLFARRVEALSEIAGQAAGAHVLPGDVTVPEDVERAVESLSRSTGRLDVLFNNAGLFPQPGEIDEVPVAEWQRAVDVNLTGMFLAARAAYGQMRRQTPKGGRIINNGSVSAQVPRGGAVGYTVTKHAINGLTKQIALDGRAHGIACGQIDIGNAATDLMRGIAEHAVASGEPPLPMFDVSEVARAVWQMATLPPEANVLTMTLMATQMPLVGRG